MKRLLFIAAALVLAACTEKPQSLGSPKQHAAPFQGTGAAFAVPGWKQGDAASWEQQMKARTQNGQNEYNKVN